MASGQFPYKASNLIFNIPAGTGCSVTEDEQAIYLRIDKNTQPFQSNGPKKSMMLASTGGFVGVSGFKVSANVLMPK